MLINLFGLLFLAVFAYVGYRRGALRMVCSLAALALGGLLAQPTAGIGAALAGSRVPLALSPLVGALISGILWFVVFSLPMDYFLTRRQKQREEEGRPRVERWDALLGINFGLVWGLLLFALILGGLSAAGRAQHAVRRAEAETAYRSMHPGPWMEVNDETLKLETSNEGLEHWGTMVQGSVFAPVAERLTPISDKTERTISDLNVILNDPALLRLFVQEAPVREFIKNPKLIELTQDQEVVRLATSQDYQGLLNHPKVAELAKDKELIRQVKAMHLPEVIEDVRQKSKGY